MTGFAGKYIALIAGGLLSAGFLLSKANADPLANASNNAADTAQFQNWLDNGGVAQPARTQPAYQPTAPVVNSYPANPPMLSAPVANTYAASPMVVNPAAANPYMNPQTVAPPVQQQAPAPSPTQLTYKQAREEMIDSAPPTMLQPGPDSRAAFDAMMQQNMPLSPQQVVRLRQLIDQSQRAASVQPNIPPKPVSTTLMINLAPGTTPPAIRLAQGYVTSLVFVDSTGAPWPIGAYDIGNPKATNIQWDGKSNILLIQAITPYSDGNLVIRLAGLPTPITLELVSGQRVVDYRTDIHVSGIGPNAKELPTGVNLPPSANQLLLNVLDGVAPAGSKQLLVSGGDADAWVLNDQMFLRTRLTVLSPGWVGRMTSPDGMIAYQLAKTPSILVSQYGKPIELKIEGF